MKATEQSADGAARGEVLKQRKAILDLLGSETQLRSKRELIERFIDEQMPRVVTPADVASEFSKYWENERARAFDALCTDEGLEKASGLSLIDEYHFTGRLPLRERIVEALLVKPKLLQRRAIVERVSEKLLALVSTFDDGIGEI